MYVAFGESERYPLKLSDTWGGQTYINISTIRDDSKWNSLIGELNWYRKAVLTKYEREGS